MYSEERRRQIASLTAVEGRVNVTELAARFDVTAETIRRDLAVLDRENHFVRNTLIINKKRFESFYSSHRTYMKHLPPFSSISK